MTSVFVLHTYKLNPSSKSQISASNTECLKRNTVTGKSQVMKRFIWGSPDALPWQVNSGSWAPKRQ